MPHLLHIFVIILAMHTCIYTHDAFLLTSLFAQPFGLQPGWVA